MSEKNKKELENQNGEQNTNNAGDQKPAETKKGINLKEAYRNVCLQIIEVNEKINDLDRKLFNDPKNKDLKKERRGLKNQIRILKLKKNAGWIALGVTIGVTAAIVFARQLAKENGSEEFLPDENVQEDSVSE